jgi:fermentation-respiration switch protein FrsA (DUF1100 family)
LHGKADNLVPFYMGAKLFDEANEPKSSYFPTFDGHMMKYDEGMKKNLDKLYKIFALSNIKSVFNFLTWMK